MKEVKEVKACVVDNGLVGVPIAERLARDMDKVWVFTHWDKGQNKFEEAIISEGFESIERCYDMFDIINDVDLFVFPDVGQMGLQLDLLRRGKKVWGSRTASLLELDRELHMQILGEVGLEEIPHEVVVGVTKLRTFLKDKTDYYVKLSYYRGSFETTHYRSWALDRSWIDSLGVRFGPFQDEMRFVCCPDIDTPLEIGCDCYNVFGKFPSRVIHGIEAKDRSYLGAVTSFDKLPQQLKRILNAYGPVLGKHNYCNQFSVEARVKGDKSYFTDPTTRMGLPSTASQLELWNNWSKIVWRGANGELVEPVATAKYSAEAMVYFHGDYNEWRVCEFPKELHRWLKVADACVHKGLLAFPPSDAPGGDDIGWLCAIGDTPEQAVKQLNKHADMLPDGLDANCESISYVLKEIHEMEAKGLYFGTAPVPEPALAVA